MFRSRNAQDGECMREDVLYGCDEAEACFGGLCIDAEDSAFSVEMMEEAASS